MTNLKKKKKKNFNKPENFIKPINWEIQMGVVECTMKTNKLWLWNREALR